MLYGMISLAEAYTGYELDMADNAATVDLAKARLSSIAVASRCVFWKARIGRYMPMPTTKPCLYS